MKPMTMTDMAKTPEEVKEETAGMSAPMVSPANINRYPYGLCISLTEEELDKLGLEPTCEVGDMLHLHALAKVTSVSQNETEAGTRCRIELQITQLEVESEDEENEEADKGNSQKRASKRYGADDADEEDAEEEA